MSNDSQNDAELSPEQIQNQFQTLAAEADLYAQKGGYKQAIERYTLALNLKPSDKNCLVSRSRCNLLAGNAAAALSDANEVLQADPNFFKAMYMKAEALYAIGDFEFALVHFHRGTRARPEFSEFRVGVQKAREAIENAIGNPQEVKIRSLAKGNFASVKVGNILNDNKNEKTKDKAAADTRALGTNSFHSSESGISGGFAGGNSQSLTNHPFFQTGAATCSQPAMEKKLLGELFEDKLYLIELLEDERKSATPNFQLFNAIVNGLEYLDSRLEFWRQQNPLYARPKQQVKYYKLQKEASKAQQAAAGSVPKSAPAKLANSAAKKSAAPPKQTPILSARHAKPATASVQIKSSSGRNSANGSQASLNNGTAAPKQVPKSRQPSKTAQALKNSPLALKI